MKRNAVLTIAATAIAAGIILASAPMSRGVALAAEIPTTVAWVLLYVWYKEDVAQRSVRTSTEFNGFVIAMSMLALPIYFVRSRGLVRGVATAMLFYLGMLGWVLLESCALAVALAARAG